MSKLIKSCLGISAVLILVIFGAYKCNQYNSSLDKEIDEESKERFFSENPSLKDNDFNELSTEDKNLFLEQILKGDFEPFSRYAAEIEFRLGTGFKQFIKFPQTLEYETVSGWGEYAGFVSNSKIEDASNGILVTSGGYRAENKLGLKVRGEYTIRYKFDGKKLEILNVTTE